MTDGCWSSIQLFLKSLAEHGEQLPHVLIRNSGRLMSAPDWSYLDAVSEYREAIENHCVAIADFPLIATPVLFELDRKHLTFGAAVEGSNSLLARRTGYFINQFTGMFDHLFEQLPGLVDGKLNPKTTRKKVSIEDLAAQLNKDVSTVTHAVAKSKNPTELAKNLSIKDASLEITSEQFQKMKDKIPANSSVT